MSKQWHYTENGEQRGPVGSNELKSKVGSGAIGPNELIWKEGMPEWVPVSKIKGLAPTAVPPAVPTGAPSSGGFPPIEDPQTSAAFGPPVATTLPFDFDTEKAAATTRQIGNQAKDAAMAAGTDAFLAFKALASNPVGGLRIAFENLGPSRAMIVGIVFGIIFDLCILIGVRSFLHKSFDMPSKVPGSSAPGIPVGMLIKLMFLGLVPLVSATAGCAATRTIFRGKGNIQSDIFIAGSSLLPVGVAVFLMGILGLANIEVIALLAVFALTTTILMMYSGCTTLQGIPDAAATLSVPLMILADVFVCKVIVTSILSA